MARAYSASQPLDYRPDPGSDWQTLRGELVALLDQVEGQVARGRRDDSMDGIAERMRDLRHQFVESEPQTRHREALRSVKRAVERFSERDDYPLAAPSSARDPSNPREILESAIQEIRARHAELAGRHAAPPPRSYPDDPAPRAVDSPRFDELARAVGGISGRLERFESELRGASKIQTGNVKEIAEQVAQLSHVVELLAGAVGETGQVKRLEGQIAGLARLVAQGPQVDLSALSGKLDDLASTAGRILEHEQAPRARSEDEEAIARRLDDISATVGRLADLQVEFANRAEMAAQPDTGMKDSLRSIEGAMHAIEDGVRNVYDRIDAIERAEALPPAALDRVTEELARVTETLRQPAAPEGLAHIASLVEALNERVGGLESPSIDVSALKIDMEALRDTVAGALEPRFAAIEMQIEALNERVATAPTADISVGHLEAQVRQLVARMDQTGEQLTGLARLYSKPAEREPTPDFEALAEMVASRTSEAVAQNAPASPAALPALSGSDIDEIERRVSRLVESARSRGQSDDLTGIESSIQAVNERLARLETSLTEQTRTNEDPAAAVAEPETVPDTVSADLPPLEATAPGGDNDPIVHLLSEAAGAAAQEAKGGSQRYGDAMPASPAADAPLRDRPFGPDMSAVKAALEAKNGPRQRHPGLLDEPVEETRADESTDLLRGDAESERPPRPVSSFEVPSPAFEDEASAETRNVDNGSEQSHTPNANTFIAAARRAAMRQPAQGASNNSLIARAFASFQAGNVPTDNAAPVTADTPVAEETPAPDAKKERKKRGLGRLVAGDKEPRNKLSPGSEPTPTATVASNPAPVETELALHHEDQPTAGPEETTRESFLSRHRRPILLAASIVAIAFLTLNLINQRMSQSSDEASATGPGPARSDQSQAVPPALPLSAEPMAATASAAAGPRVIPIVDSLSMAAADPAAAKGFSPTVGAAPDANAFVASARSETTPATDAIVTASIGNSSAAQTPVVEPLGSPVQLAMPPEALGPEELRSAAANGDPRAQFEIAAIYTEGRAVAEDLAEAAVWYERSAAQGFAPAQYRLGNLFENGRGVDKDLQLARLWYQRAAEAGNRMAMHNLAALYAGGELGKQQFDTAAEWFEQAARRGMRDSQFNLGMLYARGLGVTQDLESSYRWFSLAALHGDQDAAKARDDVARSLDAETVGRLNGELASFVLADIDLDANFAPIGTWSDTFDPGQEITSREVVISVQMALNSLGFDVGVPDGLAGPKTAEAIRAFERETGMSERGAVNPRLLAVLGSQPV